ncbi:MAG: Protein translocase subunit SecA [candidate division TM6 bacterium GW2011_GWF2_32_72]|nr:MAG: Protein translocase subunit SecA [candidate division TM6 bacterium GW2011_GWF2_32_72]
MFAKLFRFIVGSNNARQLKKLKPIVRKINSLEPQISALTDEQLAAKTNEFREQLAQGKTLDDILPEAFAVVRETSKRFLGQRHYDVQLIGGMVLHQGKIAEMKTGEGKTLTATLPLYLNALSGKAAHLVTVNEYLADRDANWMKPIYNHLGLSVASLKHSMTDAQRKEAYNADILYATNSELGFDYLRDNMKSRLEDYVQRDLAFAIVDEVDSILIDEARTPLIISGSSGDSSNLYVDASKVVSRLTAEDVEVDEKDRNVMLTESGVDKVESAFRLKNLYAVENINILHHVSQALRAHKLFRKDVEYIVRDGEVLIVDEFTGRVLAGRRYSDGLHQSIEAKEGVTIEQETQTLASITLQNFFRLYKKLSGMTGTALTEAEEFYKTYGMDVIVIPTNKPMIRQDKSDLIFLSQKGKFDAIVEDIKERHAKGQPVLIGTVAVETSELLSDHLRKYGIAHEVLNAKQHAREAEIVEHAGEAGRVTIATNMAGRGTDIKLNPEAMAAGGLYILGTERHESRRIDNQLRGRSGRQGDAGESRFYISLEDDLIRRFAGEGLKKKMLWAGMKEDEVIESNFISKQIEKAQEKVEKNNFESRKHLLEYDDVLNQQRMVIYEYRREVLEGQENIYQLIRDLLVSVIQTAIAIHCPIRNVTEEQVQNFLKAVSGLTGLPVDIFFKRGISTANSEVLKQDMINFLLEQYDLYRNQANRETIQNAEKWLMLETIDGAWKQHMLNLDHLKEGIGLRGYGQKNPLTEYKRESFQMFEDMMNQIKWEIIHHVFHLNLDNFDSRQIEEKRNKEMEALNYISSDESLPTEPRQVEKTGRNEPCPCGSGKKFKKCCMKN